MAVWYKEGVYGELQTEAAQGLRKLKKYAWTAGEDIFITSVREGTHSAGSLHPLGYAWDMRKNIDAVMVDSILGPDFDVVDETNHIHVEYDPK